MKSSLSFAVILSLLRPLSTLFPFANAALVNVTIDDSDDAISYTPSASWLTTNNLSCSECLQPNAQLAFKKTLHYALHPTPPPDPDDTTPPTSSGPAPSTPAPSNSGDPDSDHDEKKGKDVDKHSRRMVKLRRGIPDSDDPNFVDVNVTASLNFTGSAFYVFCALPVQINNATILSKTNLTFFLDGQPVGSFNHDPQNETGSSTGFQYQIPVFSKDDLPYAQHVLDIRPQLGSMALLDYVQYSTLDDTNGSPGNTTPGTAPGPTPSGSVNSQKGGGDSDSKKNTATFGAAIGSTVGVLAIISFAVFVSIYRRRRLSAKREKRLEAEEVAARPSSPEMRGPQPFIPRYFPGHPPPRVPPSPPPLSGPSSSSGSEELGPSHGLDFPPAPEHIDAPAYSPPSLVLSERAGRIPVTLRPHVTRIPSINDDETVPPRYQDVGRTPLVSIPILTHVPLPPGLVESPSSSWPPDGEESPTSTTDLFPRRPVSNQGESAAGRTNEPTIHINERPR